MNTKEKTTSKGLGPVVMLSFLFRQLPYHSPLNSYEDNFPEEDDDCQTCQECRRDRVKMTSDTTGPEIRGMYSTPDDYEH